MAFKSVVFCELVNIDKTNVFKALMKRDLSVEEK